MILAEIISIFLRIGELIFSIIVLGLTSSWLHLNHNRAFSPRKSFIYTAVIACISIICALILLLPFAGNFSHWPVDLVLFITNMVAFGLLARYHRRSCGSIWYRNDFSPDRACGRYRSNISFLFLASIFFLASALLGMYIMRKRRRNTVVDTQANNNRKRWYRNRN
ncbi:hypothetical protein Golomagni_01040 [Golovinomyces magnicellulatus]|nr:hypothetical protein Golomagni_01040 [Golovinomyces magnicellulatus]